MADEPESYQANTVEELRDELRARGLPTSGHKDELVARLEEDDAAAEAEQAEEAEVEAQDAPPPEEFKMVFSPYELPANTELAQAYVDAHPDSVDSSVPIDDTRVAQAQEAITDYGSEDDPRLSGGDIIPTALQEEEETA